MIDQSVYGKVPPQALDVEEAVIGAILTNSHAIHTCAPILSVEDFYKLQHQDIYQTVISLYNSGQNIDILTVMNEAPRIGKQIDALSLAEITGKVGSSAHLEQHCRIVKEKSIRREIIQQAAGLTKDAFDESVDALELLNTTDLMISQVKESILKGKKSSMDQIAQDVINSLSKGDDFGIQLTGIESVDRLIGRGEPGDLIIIGARPGMGKSILANTMSCFTGIRQGRNTLLWALEMSNSQNMKRAIANVGNISQRSLKRGEIPFEALEPTLEKITKSNMRYEEVSGVNAMDVRSRLIADKRSHGLDLAIIDHGGLLNHMNPKGTDTVEIGNTTKLLKQTAKELKIPIIVFWQLNRSVESRNPPIPRLSDLRQSGRIEEDADKILFLYRPEYYGIDRFTFKGDTVESKDVCVLLCEKYRDGQTGRELMKFVPDHGRFEEQEEDFIMPGSQLFPQEEESPF